MARDARKSARWPSVQTPIAARLRSAAIIVAMLASWSGMAWGQDLVKSGTVKIEQVQLAFIASGNLGGGTLQFKDKSYPFTIGGLGAAGIGVSKITATGEVYNLTDPRKFSGAYAQARYGAAVGAAGAGELWLQNGSGVVLKLKTEEAGVALSLGGDAVFISLD